MGRYYSEILKNAILPLADRVMKTNLAVAYKQTKKLRRYSKNEIRLWQNQRLKLLVDYAFHHSVYYKKLFKKIGLVPDDICTVEDLIKIPVLTKDIIRENFKSIISDEIANIPHKKSATGGSTGDPLIYYLDNRSWSMSNANNIINWEKVGYNYGDKFIALGSTSLHVNKKPSIKHQIYYKLKNKVGLNGINMSEYVCCEYINLLIKYKIRFIYGYASAIYLLAKYVLENNRKIKIRACFPTSEVLTDQFRKTIQDAFNCQILDCYGANDGGVTAYAKDKGYFEVGYNAFVRIENPDHSGIGSALLTDLSNFAMPFINYKLGDEIQIDELKNKDYPYNGQVINQILGRTSDILCLENGHTLTGPGLTVLFKDIPVEYYGIEKSTRNSITCWLIKLPEYNESHETIILETLRKHAGDDTNVVFKYTEKPLLSNSGKRQYFVQH